MQTIRPREIITGNAEIAVKLSATTSLQTLLKVVLVKCLWTIKPPSALCLCVKDSRQFYWPFWRFDETEFTTYCQMSTLYYFFKTDVSCDEIVFYCLMNEDDYPRVGCCFYQCRCLSLCFFKIELLYCTSFLFNTFFWMFCL